MQADFRNPKTGNDSSPKWSNSVGAPDILVNNAAVTFLRPLDGFPERRARLMMEMHCWRRCI